MSEHTKEPWEVMQYYQSGSHTGIFKRGDTTLTLLADVFGEENARRIVACVNACEGLSTEWLEACDALGIVINHGTKVTQRVTDQRDRLLDALKGASGEFKKLPHSLGYDITHCEKYDDIIAEIEGSKT